MIIELEGFFHQVLLVGKKCSKQQLKQMYILVKELTSETKDIPQVFCRIYNFEEIPYDKHVEVNFVIDTDTDRVYSPRY
ncbi:hypothetical protein BACCIP111895_00765 [Neobacillus rhizosphaerae]|uniref:Uncharacterized protein n=1 Tax=Neobacillus rhizosphaerae TaxID=2880965 RepID=A0ABN8KN91_9BACI|nr:hypothetical protein [Neobacillus rhizosphaerae]CAH2713629.1 hypothetical protein BACCIP111895_00765 [Neobacillus rhizosphaerae]